MTHDSVVPAAHDAPFTPLVEQVYWVESSEASPGAVSGYGVVCEQAEEKTPREHQQR